MKRDMDLVRKILFFLEDRDEHKAIRPLQIESVDQRTVDYHLWLMAQAGLIDVEPIVSSTSDRVINVIPFGLTWQGHEFLDLARRSDIWQKALGKVGEVAGGVGIDLLKAALKAELRDKLGIEI